MGEEDYYRSVRSTAAFNGASQDIRSRLLVGGSPMTKRPRVGGRDNAAPRTSPLGYKQGNPGGVGSRVVQQHGRTGPSTRDDTLGTQGATNVGKDIASEASRWLALAEEKELESRRRLMMDDNYDSSFAGANGVGGGDSFAADIVKNEPTVMHCDRNDAGGPGEQQQQREQERKEQRHSTRLPPGMTPSQYIPTTATRRLNESPPRGRQEGFVSGRGVVTSDLEMDRRKQQQHHACNDDNTNIGVPQAPAATAGHHVGVGSTSVVSSFTTPARTPWALFNLPQRPTNTAGDKIHAKKFDLSAPKSPNRRFWQPSKTPKA